MALMFEALRNGVTDPLHMSGPFLFLFMMIGMPVLLAFAVTREWRLVFKASLIWIGLLVGGFFFVTGGKLNDMAFGAMTYGMFFSIIAVPAIAPLLKVSRFLRRSWRLYKLSRRALE